ncbi:LANO_0G00298g1_1 [Lachancea nothofagi CBS 11611]|uniref:LANO_0G00298g1_1 n=1 Tax=Lachancea nothofagi CBS 11611 TaxID=1266666 RepID=A0A1G4KE54_9SACH|nr:LANO_0G00298g1_1 [Lachancea nothofagi CBS 11611]
MEQLNEIGQLLLVRSQETLQRLDGCIDKQRRLYECRNVSEKASEDSRNNLEHHYTYLGQLNALYFKTQSLKSGGCSIDASDEGLSFAAQSVIAEFERLTRDLQERTSLTVDIDASPRSTLSFQPKPLKIIQRKLAQRAPSPIETTSFRACSYPDKSCKSISSTPDSFYYNHHISAPNSCKSSPARSIAERLEPRFIRGAISCDAGLNRQTNPHENRLSFFRDRQRLSISFIEDDEYSSDEETVISPSPVATPFLKSNTRAGSSSLRKMMLKESPPSRQSFKLEEPQNHTSHLPHLLPKNLTMAQCDLTSINYRPVGSTESSVNKINDSRRLLAKLAASESKKKTKNWFSDTQSSGLSFLKSIKSFNNQVLVTPETGFETNDGPKATRVLRQARPLLQTTRPSRASGTIVIHGSSGSRFITAPRETELHFKISHDALREALNTELNCQ